MPQGDLDDHRTPSLAAFLDKLIAQIKRHSAYAKTSAILFEALIVEKDFNAARSGASLPPAQIQALVALVNDPEARAVLAAEARLVLLARRGGWTGALAKIHSLSPRRLYCGKAEAAGVPPGEDYWTLLLFRVQEGLGLPAIAPERLDRRRALADIVDRPRIQFGEAVALRHAIILFQAVRHSRPLGAETAATVLELAFVVLDLAAQINESKIGLWVTSFLKKTLSQQLRRPIERIVCDRIIHSSRATLSGQKRSGWEAADTPVGRDEEVRQALVDWRVQTRELGFTRDYPRIGLTLSGVCFQRISTLMGRAAPLAEIADAIALHDEVSDAFSIFNGPMIPLKGALGSSEFTAVYWSDLQADFSLYRSGSAQRTPRGFPVVFDPEHAMAICETALASADPNNHFADTAFASLRRTRAEAVLAKAGKARFAQWSAPRQNAYLSVRAEAAAAYAAVGMPWKLARLRRLEERAGLVAEERGLRPLGRAYKAIKP